MSESTFVCQSNDGIVLSFTTTSYEVARSGLGYVATDNTHGPLTVDYRFSYGWWMIAEIFYRFDTSSVGGDQVTDAALRLRGYPPMIPAEEPITIAVYAYPGWDGNLAWVPGDDVAALTLVGLMDWEDWNPDGYNTFQSAALNAAVNTGGYTSLLVCIHELALGTPPTGGGNYVSVGMYENGQGYWPELVVTHSPAPSIIGPVVGSRIVGSPIVRGLRI